MFDFEWIVFEVKLECYADAPFLCTVLWNQPISCRLAPVNQPISCRLAPVLFGESVTMQRDSNGLARFRYLNLKEAFIVGMSHGAA